MLFKDFHYYSLVFMKHIPDWSVKLLYSKSEAGVQTLYMLDNGGGTVLGWTSTSFFRVPAFSGLVLVVAVGFVKEHV